MRKLLKILAVAACGVTPVFAGCGGSGTSAITPSESQTRTTLSAQPGKPTRVPFPAPPFTFPAGIACRFSLHYEAVKDNEAITTFPAQPNGDVVQSINGLLYIRFTNVDNGKSIVKNLSGPLTMVTHPNGSATADERGPSFIVFFPTDIPPGPDLYIAYGRTILNFTVSGQEILVSETGTRFDVCSALS